MKETALTQPLQVDVRNPPKVVHLRIRLCLSQTMKSRANVNPLSHKLHIQILHTDIHTDIQSQPLREN